VRVRFWLKLGLSVFAIFVLLDRSAAALGSLRGEAGIPVAVLTVLGCLLAERTLWGRRGRAAFDALGLGFPTARSLAVACGVGALLIVVLPAFAALARADAVIYPRWFALLPGLFAQGGVAEEVLFRGYLFGTVRQNESFTRAAMFSMGPFLLAHLLMFATMSWPIALAATLLSVVVSFPLTHLFELGGRTIWAPALLHFFIQSPIKIVDMSGPTAAVYPLVWMAACALIPWLVFLYRVPASTPRNIARAARVVT
jgi:membrane protease YdiL (CAAX protease family)